MQYYSLKDVDIRISKLGFGCLQLGGHGWGETSEEEMVQAVHKAIEYGVTLFDTAPIYGLGRSEEILGRILGKKRKDIVIATKFGLVWNKGATFSKYTDCSPVNIEKEIDMSLKRLRTDYIDIYQIHWPDLNNPLEKTMRCLEKLKKAGKIFSIGVCNYSEEQLREAIQYAQISTCQVPYNLVDRKIEKDILPFCKENNIAVLAYSPLARGLLSGKYNETTIFPENDHRNRDTDEYFKGQYFKKNLKIVKRVQIVADKLHLSPSQIALKWVSDSPYISTAIFGAKNAAQVKECSSVSDIKISQEDIKFLSADEND